MNPIPDNTTMLVSGIYCTQDDMSLIDVNPHGYFAGLKYPRTNVPYSDLDMLCVVTGWKLGLIKYHRSQIK